MARNVAIDILKLCLSLLVVMLHCSLFKDVNASLYYVTVNGICRIAVPVFLVISGYYFFYINDFKKLIKWGKRLLILYLIWMILYSSFWFSSSLAENIKNLFWGYFVLWYLIGTFFGGLLVYWLRNYSLAFQIGLVALCFFTGYTIQIIGNLHVYPRGIDQLMNESRNYRNFLIVCFPFMMIGFWINKYKINHKININIYLIVCLFLLLIFESFIHYYFISHKESLDLLAALLLVAPAIFIFTLKKDIQSHSKNIATLSTAIYLIHPMIMFEVAKKFDANNTIVFTAVVLSTSITLGYLLILLNKRIKYLL